MSRSARLLDLVQSLRRRRLPVSGQDLAAELGVSIRTLYRDIATMQAQGAPIEGEAGVGYVLRPGFVLPPLMFTEDEIDALALGAQFVARRGDSALAAAALDALAKIEAVLPEARRSDVEDTSFLVAPDNEPIHGTAGGALIRQAIRSEHKLAVEYRDGKGGVTSRVIWPFALGYFERVQMVAAWCEFRGAFRHFRPDRMATVAATKTRYPRRKRDLLKAWREIEREAPRDTTAGN